MKMETCDGDHKNHQMEKDFIEVEDGTRIVERNNNKSDFESMGKSNAESSVDEQEIQPSEVFTRMPDERSTHDKINQSGNSKMIASSKNEKHEDTADDDRITHKSSSNQPKNPVSYATVAMSDMPIPALRTTDSDNVLSSKRCNPTSENVAAEPLEEILNPSDVHFDVDNHPGTVIWRNIIAESIQRFPVKSYTFRKHNWVMRQLRGRNFFFKEKGSTRKQLNRSQIRKNCKNQHDKHIEIQRQIISILSDLNDVKNSQTFKTRCRPFHPSANNVKRVEERDETTLENARNTVVSEHETREDSNQHDDSSSETVSTLTHSQIQDPSPVEARSTPWIEGNINNQQTRAHEENCEKVPIDDSVALQREKHVIFDNSTLLENLRNLWGDRPLISEHKRSSDDGKNAREFLKSKLSRIASADTRAEIMDQKESNGGPEDSKQRFDVQSKSDEQVKSLAGSDYPNDTSQGSRSSSILGTSLKRLPLKKQQSYVSEGSGRSKQQQKSRMFRPLWRRALHRNKRKNSKADLESTKTTQRGQRTQKAGARNFIRSSLTDFEAAHQEGRKAATDAPPNMKELMQQQDSRSIPKDDVKVSPIEVLLGILDDEDTEASKDRDTYEESSSGSSATSSSGTWSSYGEGTMNDPFQLFTGINLQHVFSTAPFDADTL
jgi:hypothetical protein